MDSLVLLCARRVIAQRPLPALPAGLYPVLFQVAFLDRRALVLQDLVAAWPFPDLHVQRLVGCQGLLEDDPFNGCVQAVIQAVVAQVQRELEEPGCHSSGCRLRVLDMTGFSDDPEWWRFLSRTQDLAKACVEVSKHQQEFQRRRPKRHTGCSGASTAVAAPQLLGIDVHADLLVNGLSYGILHDALQTGATGPLRLKCREFKAVDISASEIVTLLESLDPSCVRRVNLRFNKLGLTELSVILPHLSRFPGLHSLKLWNITMDVRHLTPESAIGIHCVARQLGMLPSLRELNLGSTQLPGNLCQILRDLQAPLESLELGSCSLLPTDLIFLSQSIHAPALKTLDLSGNDFSQGLLEPLQLLLEETSASLLHLNLRECRMGDSHLAALLPTLLRCSRLRFLGVYHNRLSTATLKDLLQKTLELPDLQLVAYPYPIDCYKPDSAWPFVVDVELLSAATTEISQVLENSGRTDVILSYDRITHRHMDYFL